MLERVLRGWWLQRRRALPLDPIAGIGTLPCTVLAMPRLDLLLFLITPSNGVVLKFLTMQGWQAVVQGMLFLNQP